MLLPAIGIRVCKCYFETKLCQILINTPVVSCCTIPIRRGQTGAEYKKVSLIEFLADGNQLLGTMSAGVPLQYGPSAVRADLPARRFVPKQASNFFRHLNARIHNHVILTRPKQLLYVTPGRADEACTASQGFKDTDRRNAAQPVTVLTPRYMQRKRAPRICVRSHQARQVSAIFNSRSR